MSSLTYGDLRQDYKAGFLEIEEVDKNPINQFTKWFDEAISQQILEPNAMSFSTATKEGKPSCRILLLKDILPSGFVFYSNYESRKGKEMEENPFGAMTFLWLQMERQVRIEGKIEKVSREEAEIYFKSRPKGSQIGAWSSPQSQKIADRSILENKVASLENQYASLEQLPMPPFWGGYILIPNRIEFWQGRSSRLHDRICYERKEGNQWDIFRLAP
jgi:pyridoxamine 5'-phosphate oxidase